jgi:hypothetical protein
MLPGTVATNRGGAQGAASPYRSRFTPVCESPFCPPSQNAASSPPPEPQQAPQLQLRFIRIENCWTISDYLARLFEKCIGNRVGGQRSRPGRANARTDCVPTNFNNHLKPVMGAAPTSAFCLPANQHGNLDAPVSAPVLTGLNREKVCTSETQLSRSFGLFFGMVPACCRSTRHHFYPFYADYVFNLIGRSPERN